MEELPGRARAGGNENFGCLTAREVGLKFVFCLVGKDLFVLRVHYRLVHFSGVVQCAGHLYKGEESGRGKGV